MVKRVIIADDDKNVRETLTDLVLNNLADVEIVTVPNGKVLVEEVRKDSYSLVLTDNAMPEMDGLQAIQEIRKFNPEIIIYMIAGGDVEKEALQAGATGYIEKTKYRENLSEILDQYL